MGDGSGPSEAAFANLELNLPFLSNFPAPGVPLALAFVPATLSTSLLLGNLMLLVTPVLSDFEEADLAGLRISAPEWSDSGSPVVLDAGEGL